MLHLIRPAASVLIGIILPISLHAQAGTPKLAWPDGASAKVHVRSEGRQVSESKTEPWDMFCDFTMHLKRINDQIVVSRNDHSGWKGTLAPPLGAGAEQFIDMVPTLIVTDDGTFVGIEGHETARKLMARAIEQSGTLDEMLRKVLETISSNASLEAMARDHWTAFVLWKLVELNPGASYEFRSVVKVPQLGGGVIELDGTIKFVKEAPCESTRNDQRCIHLYSESGGNKAQVRKTIQSLLQREGPEPLTVTDWDQQVKVEIVVERKTMLPQHLKVTRFHSLTVKHKVSGESQTSSGEYSTTYTFAWLLPADERKKNVPPEGPALDFSQVTSKRSRPEARFREKACQALSVPRRVGWRRHTRKRYLRPARHSGIPS
jgi:hypothetical protein